MTEVRSCFSSALRRRQCASTSAAVSATSSPKTCGCRCTSFVTSVPATSSIANGSSASSWAIRAWKTTWSRTSPNSSRSSPRSPASMASTSSYISSTPYLTRSWWVRRALHGHARRIRSMTSTTSSRRAPGRS
uniref:Uncharacterized 14.2 kDa protein in blaB 3'region n=1 Tax=Streptomyces cacaoi TaxID=1898 RepID=YBL2_STRCI|nr:RecName: Full=Uncharacterized 14.2 kDa protein in blaB 3'region [Streptomyces cacaoi]BAA00776.1 regulatory protein for beta-lactamase [Streptomyces cacaoi]